jgi:hypothetical protein
LTNPVAVDKTGSNRDPSISSKSTRQPLGSSNPVISFVIGAISDIEFMWASTCGIVFSRHELVTSPTDVAIVSVSIVGIETGEGESRVNISRKLDVVLWTRYKVNRLKEPMVRYVKGLPSV